MLQAQTHVVALCSMSWNIVGAETSHFKGSECVIGYQMSCFSITEQAANEFYISFLFLLMVLLFAQIK